ncbi:MAG: hypothetical protein LH610_08000 [Sphingomonas bacterium]|nr:hypothetical protein [Sphingomonas bacterium]
MATKLKVVAAPSDLPPPAPPPAFDPAPTRNRRADWTADRQRNFIDILSLTGSVGEASAAAGVSSRSAYRLRNRAGAASFPQAWDAAQQMSATRLTALAFDRAINGRVERFYKDGEVVMERRLPSDRLLTWLLTHLDPMRFGGPMRQAMLGTADPRTLAANALPALTTQLADVDAQDCECEPPAFVDHRAGEMGAAGSVDHQTGWIGSRVRISARAS